MAKKKHGKEFMKGKGDEHGLDRTEALKLATGRSKSKRGAKGGKKSRRGSGRY